MSKIVESLYRITGVELNENIHRLSGVIDIYLPKGLNVDYRWGGGHDILKDDLYMCKIKLSSKIKTLNDFEQTVLHELNINDHDIKGVYEYIPNLILNFNGKKYNYNSFINTFRDYFQKESDLYKEFINTFGESDKYSGKYYGNISTGRIKCNDINKFITFFKNNNIKYDYFDLSQPNQWQYSVKFDSTPFFINYYED